MLLLDFLLFAISMSLRLQSERKVLFLFYENRASCTTARNFLRRSIAMSALCLNSEAYRALARQGAPSGYRSSSNCNCMAYVRSAPKIALLVIVANPLATKIGEVVHRIFGSRRKRPDNELISVESSREYFKKSDHTAFCERIAGKSKVVQKAWKVISRYKVSPAMPVTPSGNPSPLGIACNLYGLLDSIIGAALTLKMDNNQPICKN